jgi:hypothetical protein
MPNSHPAPPVRQGRHYASADQPPRKAPTIHWIELYKTEMFPIVNVTEWDGAQGCFAVVAIDQTLEGCSHSSRQWSSAMLQG